MGERTEAVGLPRDERWRMFTRRCIDPNCDGELVREGRRGSWRCNGLTFRGKPEDGEPLQACSYWHDDGDVRATIPEAA